MDESAAKYVLLDFEVITLIALAFGLVSYAVIRRVRRIPPGHPVYFRKIDLLLIWLPAMMYLLNPVLQIYFPTPMETVEGAERGRESLDSFVMNIGFFGFVGLITVLILEVFGHRKASAVLGLKRMSFPMIVVFSIVVGILSLLVCAWLVGGLSQSILGEVFGKLDEQEPVRMFRESNSVIHLVCSTVLACVAAPVVEELLFRGYMYGVIKKFTSPIFSAVTTGALFAVVHGNLPALLPVWSFAIVLTIAYEVTRCLWVPIGIHAFFNAANVVLLFVPQSDSAAV